MDDLCTLPDLPSHTQLIDGSLVFRHPQTCFHSITTDVLREGLARTAPAALRVHRQMVVVLDPANGLEPDVSVLRRPAVEDWHRMTFPVADVLLAVEVVSPDSLSRDSTTKPQKYAAAGIPHFWLVEMAGLDDHAAVQVYERGGASGTYALAGIHRGLLKLSVPYDIDIDLTAIDEL